MKHDFDFCVKKNFKFLRGFMVDMANFDFTYDVNKYLRLGFDLDEIENTIALMQNGFRISSSSLMQIGYDNYKSSRMVHLKNLIEGRETVSNEEELIKHLKKLWGSKPRISMSNLEVSRIEAVPRTAVVLGIKDKPYDIWNSDRYHGKEMLYIVREVTGQNIIIETSRKPALKREDADKIDGVLEIVGATMQKKAIVKFDKKYCKLCNRFIILASLRRPEKHHGMFNIICRDGTRVYVYAATLNAKDKMRYNQSSQRVYDFGCIGSDIANKLKSVALHVYDRLGGVKVSIEQANENFILVTRDEDTLI